ncbi:MAG: carbohydrate ABC transporter permease [Treponema sp.]|nr:carbohydrate ABC transporter permease [Treponema sp.]
MVKYSQGDLVFQAVVLFLLTIIAVACAYPMLYVLSMSISDSVKIAVNPVLLLPRGFSLKAMALLFENPSIWRYYGNTVFYTVFGTAIRIIMTVLLAYPISRKTFGGRNPIAGFAIFTMLFSGGMIPTYIIINKLGLYNTIWSILLPGAISVYYAIITRTFFASLPDSLVESAKIDGANDFTILFKIIIPISKAILATLAIFYSVDLWNSYLPALLYLPNSNLHPLQMFLVKILINNDPQLLGSMEMGLDRLFLGDQLKYACIVAACLPILCVYPFFQKHFTQGVMLGSLKE